MVAGAGAVGFLVAGLLAFSFLDSGAGVLRERGVWKGGRRGEVRLNALVVDFFFRLLKL